MKLDRMRRLVLALGLAAVTTGARAEGTSQAGPEAARSAVIRISGSPADAGLISAWEKGFAADHPGVRFDVHLTGPDSTMAWLYTGKADLALLERELMAPVEHMAFTWVRQYPEFTLPVATAGATTSRLGAAIAIFVNKDNPIAHLSLQEVDSLYGADHRRGGGPVATWGDLGATDAWAFEPVHVYGPDLDSAWALSLRHAVLQDSYKWSAAYREISGGEPAVLDAVAKDRDGVAYGPLAAGNDRVKTIALSTGTASDKPVVLSAESLQDRSYPLRRSISFVLDRTPGAPVEPTLKAFLLYVLSDEGQKDVAADGAYVPLDPTAIAQQRARLD